MAFYVKLGPRGIIFRVGTGLIGLLGSLVYWRASRRRGKIETLAGTSTMGPGVGPRTKIDSSSSF